MIRLIKMDIYRMIKSKGTWVLIIIYLCLSAILEATENQSISIVDNSSISIKNGNLILIGIIFSVILSNAYMKNGYIKNLSSVFAGKNNIYFYHGVSAFIFYCMLFISNIALISIVDILCYGSIKLQCSIANIAYIFIMILLLSIYCMEICCITVWTKSNVVGIFFGIVSYMYMDNFIFSVLANVIRIPYNLKKLSIIYNITGLQSSGINGEYGTALISAAIYIVFLSLFGKLLINKKEIC